MPKIDLYGMLGSAPCHAVMMTCDLVGVEYEFKVIDLRKGENKTPEYLAVSTIESALDSRSYMISDDFLFRSIRSTTYHASLMEITC